MIIKHKCKNMPLDYEYHQDWIDGNTWYFNRRIGNGTDAGFGGKKVKYCGICGLRLALLPRYEDIENGN